MSQPAGHQRAGHQPADLAGRDEAQPGPVSTDPGFSVRHIGPDEADLAVMLAAVGVRDIDQLIDQTVPAAIRNPEPLDLPAALGETAALAELERLASRNRVVTSLIGTGYSGTHTPAVIQRNVLENPAWYTAYTPYQPEISQGRLEALLNFQTMVCDLTGMDISNSSLLDEATAAAEGMTLARRQSRNPGSAFFVDIDCHPQVIAVLRTRAEPLDIELRIGSVADLDTDGLFGALLAYPGSSGEIRDLAAPISALHDSGALAVVATDLLALCLLTPPGEFGADVVVGSAQRFGVPMGFGGPHAAFMATRDASRRSLPGRLVGVSVDAAGRPALRLALQTREQHIRREKATSNICTAQVLLAVMASMYAVYHGPEGLAAIARRVHGWTTRVALTLSEAGVEVVTRVWFDTLWVRPQGGAALALAEAERRGINLRPVDAHTVGLSFDETTDGSVVRRVLEALGVDPEAAATASAAPEVHGPGPGPGPDPESGNGPAHGDGPQGSEARTGRWPDHLRRTTPFCTHPVFSAHRTETEMLRYLRRLSDQDLALDRTMIPLGSCTMKLNATTEMIPVTWPEFGALHPFAPQSQTGGYQELVDELCEALVEITGYDAVSVQPNAGSQGEFAGLLAIRAFHRSRGEGHRVVCLIPESAHGTNAASAVMAGMSVVVVSCDQSGNVDVADLRAKAASHGPNLAALMVTYPSTHGVFEESIVEICDIVHEHGGQVYLDGANLNALVGLARPGRFGADVSHLNLHKTFCIPHGGGGPGVGPVAVRAHLAPFLPGVASAHPLTAETPGAGTPEASTPDAAVGPVSAAPLGSASILPISWTYLRLMGPDGLQRATETAILSANYIATRLSPHFPVLYSGANGRVAHECILDIRPLQRSTGITNEDIAKRLIDYGFHAPTMSFPVAGTLMVEPTESESLAELDRFCEAMIAIRAEIDLVADGTWPPEDNPLVNAPHTAQDCCSDDWTHPYQRGVAAFPPGVLPATRYWPPVSRIDGGYGDRNLVCSCPPLHELASHS